MECFERAHVTKRKPTKSSKLSEKKKQQLKQMLFGYKANDNKLIQMSTALQNDQDDSSSVSGYSDLNLTNSSYEEDNPALSFSDDFISRLNTKDRTFKSNVDEKISENSLSDCSESNKSSEVSSTSPQIVDSYEHEINEDETCFSEDIVSQSNSSIDNSEIIHLMAKDGEVDSDLESHTDTETSIVMRGLSLSDSESDISEFDANRQLAAKIQERLQLKISNNNKVLDQNDLQVENVISLEKKTLKPVKRIIKEPKNTFDEIEVEKQSIANENIQTGKLFSKTEEESKNIKNKKQKHKDKYTILLDSNEVPKGPITKERCTVIHEENILQKSKKESKKNDKQKYNDKYSILLHSTDENFVNPSDTEINKNDSYIKNTVNEDLLINETDSYLSPPYVSIKASDTPPQRLDDILGEYKHSTMKNLPSTTTAVLSTNNSGIFVEEVMNVDTQIEEDVDSLIPELDDIPKLEEIDDDIVNLDRTVESVDRTISTNTVDPDTNEKDQWVDYSQVAETFKVYYGSDCCIVTLKHPSELFIQGKVKIRSLGGTMELFGYTLTEESCDIYAPYYNIAQGIKTVESQNVYYGLFGKLTAAGLSVSEAEDIVTTLGENDGVIVLQELNSIAMDFIENNFKVTNIFRSNKTIEPFFSKASDVLHCSLFSSRPYKSFNEHPSWKEANELAMNKYSRCIVCGGKGVGKSTYVRYQVNKLLAHGPVLVLDLDPGQSLFTVAGNVSATVVTSPLLGPSFTHLRKSEIMLNMGMINTMDNVKLYAAAVRSLISYCQNNEAFADMPWIVNTMGMTISLGLKLITLIITLLQPTYVLQYESEVVNQRFATLLTPTSTKELFYEYRNDPIFKYVTYPEDLDYSFVVAHVTDSPHSSKKMFSLKPKDERYLNFLAYFSQLLVAGKEESLLGITPYQVSLKDLRIATNVKVKKEHVTKVLNGKLVALCQQPSVQSDNSVFKLTDKPLVCRGHGLIRGIDWEKEMLYVITPVAGKDLQNVDTLLYADWAPELVWYEAGLPMGLALPYRTSSTDQHKQLMSTPRRRFNNPLQLMKMAGGAPN